MSRAERHATLYIGHGRYDALTGVVYDLLVRLDSDTALGRFGAHRGEVLAFFESARTDIVEA